MYHYNSHSCEYTCLNVARHPETPYLSLIELVIFLNAESLMISLFLYSYLEKKLLSSNPPVQVEVQFSELLKVERRILL